MSVCGKLVIAELREGKVLALPKWKLTVISAGWVAVVHHVADEPQIVGPGDAIGCYTLVQLDSCLGLVVNNICARSSNAPPTTYRSLRTADKVLACYRYAEQTRGNVDDLLDLLHLSKNQKDTVNAYNTKRWGAKKLDGKETLKENKVEWGWDGYLYATIKKTVIRPPVQSLRAAFGIDLENGKVTSPFSLSVRGETVSEVEIVQGAKFTVVDGISRGMARQLMAPRVSVVGPVSSLLKSPMSAYSQIIDVDGFTTHLSQPREPQKEISLFTPYALQEDVVVRDWVEIPDEYKIIYPKQPGTKVVMHVRNGEVRLFSRSGNDITLILGPTFNKMPSFTTKGSLQSKLRDCILVGTLTKNGNYRITDTAFIEGVPIQTYKTIPRLRAIQELTKDAPALILEPYKVITKNLEQAVKQMQKDTGLDVNIKSEKLYGKNIFLSALPPTSTPIVAVLLGCYSADGMYPTQTDTAKLRFVFGVVGEKERPPGHPWDGFVPAFIFVPTSTTNPDLLQKYLSTKPCPRPAIASGGQIEKWIKIFFKPSRLSPRYKFYPKEVLQFSSIEAATRWSPVAVRIIEPEGGAELPHKIPLSTVANINKMVQQKI